MGAFSSRAHAACMSRFLPTGVVFSTASLSTHDTRTASFFDQLMERDTGARKRREKATSRVFKPRKMTQFNRQGKRQLKYYQMWHARNKADWSTRDAADAYAFEYCEYMLSKKPDYRTWGSGNEELTEKQMNPTGNPSTALVYVSALRSAFFILDALEAKKVWILNRGARTDEGPEILYKRKYNPFASEKVKSWENDVRGSEEMKNYVAEEALYIPPKSFVKAIRHSTDPAYISLRDGAQIRAILVTQIKEGVRFRNVANLVTTDFKGFMVRAGRERERLPALEYTMRDFKGDRTGENNHARRALPVAIPVLDHIGMIFDHLALSGIECGYVFTGSKPNAPVSLDWYIKGLRKIFRNTGFDETELRRIRSHSARYTGAVWMKLSGASDTTIKERGMWKSGIFHKYLKAICDEGDGFGSMAGLSKAMCNTIAHTAYIDAGYDSGSDSGSDDEDF